MSLKELISNDSSPKMKLICQAIKCESSATHSTTLNFTMQPSNTYLYPPVCLCGTPVQNLKFKIQQTIFRVK